MSNNTSVKITSAENPRCSAFHLIAQLNPAPNLEAERFSEMGCLVFNVKIYFAIILI